MKSNSVVTARQRLLARLPFSSPAGRRLLLAAALLHITLALGLFFAGRMQLAPGFIDRDGIIASFAFDSYEYQRDAMLLAGVLRQRGIAAWAGEPELVHVKPISILFALLGPLFGYGPLTAEPFNLLCYLSVICLTLALGQEIGNARIGQLAAGVVALWPTLLLHSLQLLKDPLFIAAALALVLCVTTWLTRTYSPRRAIVTGAITLVAISLLLFVRSSFAIVILGVVLFGFVLLVLRQLVERRPLYWNMVGPLFILVVGALLMTFQTTGVGQKFKHYPSTEAGEAKAGVSRGIQVRAATSYLPRANLARSPTTYTGKFSQRSHRMALRIGSVRDRFLARYSKSGSNIDTDVSFRDLKGLLSYLPRAFAVGCCAPFPTMWLVAGQRVGSAGKLLSGAETLVMYVIGLLALLAVVRPPHRLAALLLLSITILGVTLLGLVVPNIGALYRFRYVFWVLLIILGVKGFEVIRGSVRPWFDSRRTQVSSSADVAGSRRTESKVNRLMKTTVLTIACLLAISCSSRTDRSGTTSGESSGAQGNPTASSPAGAGFDLVNFSGSPIRAVYLSPGDASGWEENVLGTDILEDGATVDIRFVSNETPALWDLKVVARSGYYAEWKGLDLRGVSRVTLAMARINGPAVVAELE